MNASPLDFALALHHRLPTDGNLPWSPYSVASALGVAAAGARGRTYAQLAAVLAPDGGLAGVGRALAAAAAPGEAELAVANTLWMRAGWRFLDDYQRAVRDWPGGTLRTADFAGDPDGARVAINDDVAQTTRGLVPDLLARGVLSAETAAVIVNALYLKVAWLSPFEAAATAPAPFRAPSGIRDVPTMRQQESLPYAEGGGWRMVSLPTAGEVVVDVLLADDDRAELTSAAVASLQRAVRPVKVDLHLPSLHLDAAVTLNDHLRQAGVVDAFDRERADFSGITDAERIWIENVIHKTVLRVDEQGFEGAAATAVVMRTISMDMSQPVLFYVDRPFLLLVRHRRSGAVYFLARVEEP
jgi:serine protease inhibitor